MDPATRARPAPAGFWRRALGLALAVLIALLIAEAFLEALLHATREQGLEPARWEPDRAVPFALCGSGRSGGAGRRGTDLPRSRLQPVLALALDRARRHLGRLRRCACLVNGFAALLLFGAAVAFLAADRQPLSGMLLHGTFNALALVVAFAT